MTRWTPLLVATILSMTAPAFSQDKVVHFSSINGQTGQSAAYGSKVIEGVNLAAKAINDAGGFADKCGARYKVKITTGDMANSREQAVSLLRQAAGDASVLAVVAPSPSTGYVPMVPVAGQLKIPIIATGSAAPIKEWNPWAFRLNTVSKVAVPPLMRTLKAKFDVKRVALVYDVTQDGQRGEAELIKNAAKDVGYEVVAFEAFRAGDNDFRPQLTKIKAVKPDWIGIYGVTPELAKVVNQMAELGVKAEMITGFGTQGPNAWVIEKRLETPVAPVRLLGDNPLNLLSKYPLSARRPGAQIGALRSLNVYIAALAAPPVLLAHAARLAAA